MFTAHCSCVNIIVHDFFVFYWFVAVAVIATNSAITAAISFIADNFFPFILIKTSYELAQG